MSPQAELDLGQILCPPQLWNRLGNGAKKERLLIFVGTLAVGPSARMIIELNIRHYRKLLNTETDAAKRATIAKLLAEEEAKLASLSGQEKKDK